MGLKDLEGRDQSTENRGDKNLVLKKNPRGVKTWVELTRVEQTGWRN